MVAQNFPQNPSLSFDQRDEDNVHGETVMPLSREAREYIHAKMKQWMDEAEANKNSPNDIMKALAIAAYEDWQQRTQGRDMEPRDARP